MNDSLLMDALEVFIYLGPFDLFTTFSKVQSINTFSCVITSVAGCEEVILGIIAHLAVTKHRQHPAG